MKDTYKNVFREILEEKNVYELLHICWILEYYVLGLFSIVKLIDRYFKNFVNVPKFLMTVIEYMEYLSKEYGVFCTLMPFVFWVIGLSGHCFQYLVWTQNSIFLRQYGKIGMYIGRWLFLILVTYMAYVFFKGWYIIAYSGLLFTISGIIKKYEIFYRIKRALK